MTNDTNADQATLNTPATTVPDSLQHTAFGQWTDGSYGPTISGSGAIKLGQSVVAPIVACARGYLTLTPENVRTVMKAQGIGAQKTEGKQILRGVGDFDALLMPWYTASDVVEAPKNGGIMSPSSLQYRPHPANVVTDGTTGKKRKYENLAGQALILGVHPATPTSWLTEGVGTIMLAEGALKGDAALTALLRDHGATDADLAYQPGDDDPIVARTRLRNLLDQAMPATNPDGKDPRVLIVTIVGVTTWHQNPEWNSLRLKGTDVWVSVDGDVATNPNVWKQASDLVDHLKHRGAKPMLVDLSDIPTATGEKVGVDDYFAMGKNWRDMTGHLSLKLPPRPTRDDSGVDVRMNEHTRTFQRKTETGPGTPPVWQNVAGFTARVASIDQKRAVSPIEAVTGVYDPKAPLDPDGNRCNIEVSWFDPFTMEPGMASVEGPVDLAATPPARWREPRLNATIPTEVTMLPQWPPSDAGFLEAMKLYQGDKVIKRSSWSHMGWVPVQEKTPVFIVGKQVIGPDGNDPTLASSAVNSSILQNAENFGVELCDDEDEVRTAVRNVLDTYFACWSSRRNASTVLALALRPCAPIQPHLVAVMTGHSGLGKSFSEAAIMAFWQPHAGIWGNRALPGTAADTPADAEVSVSVTPIWVIDDLAPSNDAMSQARAQGKVNEIIRNVFNGGSKGRRRQDMTAQTKFIPRAVLVVSAESPPQEQSIINRIIHVQAQKGFLVPDREPTNALSKMMETTNDAAKITGYALTKMAAMANSEGWATVREDWANTYELAKDNLERKLKAANTDVGDPTRRAEVVADLTLGVMVLKQVLEDLGMNEDPKYRNVIKDMLADMFLIADDGFNENRTVDVGEETMHRLQALLTSGKAHIAGAGVAGVPVVIGERGSAAKADFANQNLGWQLSTSRDRDPQPQGERIGVLLYDRKNNNEPVVIVNPRAALTLIQRQWGNDGHSAASTWNAVWQAGHCYPHTWTRKSRNKGSNAVDYVIRVMVDGANFEGVPFSLAELASLGDEGVAALDCRTTPDAAA